MITLIKHAPSTFDDSGVKNKDSPIIDNSMAKLLKGEYDLVISSTLKRCRQTLDESKIIYSHLIFTNLCREYRDGNPVNLFEGESDDNLYETEENLLTRIHEFKKLLIELSKKYNKIAVISHGVFLYHLTNGTTLKNCEEFNYKLD